MQAYLVDIILVGLKLSTFFYLKSHVILKQDKKLNLYQGFL